MYDITKICKNCQNDFHSYFGEELFKTYGYCSEDCMSNADEFNKRKEHFYDFIGSLDEDSFDLFNVFFKEYNNLFIYKVWLKKGWGGQIKD